MLCLGRWLWGELSAKKASQVLAQNFCSLIPSGTPLASKVLSRQDLRAVKEAQFEWPCAEDLASSSVSSLAKNIVRNYMLNCFTQAGPTLVQEGPAAHLRRFSCHLFYYLCIFGGLLPASRCAKLLFYFFLHLCSDHGGSAGEDRGGARGATCWPGKCTPRGRSSRRPGS